MALHNIPKVKATPICCNGCPLPASMSSPVSDACFLTISCSTANGLGTVSGRPASELAELASGSMCGVSSGMKICAQDRAIHTVSNVWTRPRQTIAYMQLQDLVYQTSNISPSQNSCGQASRSLPSCLARLTHHHDALTSIQG